MTVWALYQSDPVTGEKKIAKVSTSRKDMEAMKSVAEQVEGWFDWTVERWVNRDNERSEEVSE